MKGLLAASLVALVPLISIPASAQSQKSQAPQEQAQLTPGTTSLFGPTEGSNEFTLSGTGTNDRHFDNGGFGVTGSYGWYLSRNLELSARQSVNWTGRDNASDSINGSTRGAIDYHFNLTDRFRPFVGASIGAIYGDGVHDTGIIGPEVGLKYYFNPTTFLLVQTEYQFFFEDGDDIDNNFNDGSFAHTIGLGFNF